MWWSKEMKKKEAVLQLLHSEPRLWTSQEIAERVQLSRKTTRIYIQSLNVLLEKWQVEIEVHSKGYRLNLPMNLSIHELVLEWIKEDKGILFFSELFNGTIESIEKFINKNYITAAQHYAQTKKLRAWFEEVGVKLGASPRIYLDGEESQIRYSYFHFFWTVYRGIEWPFSIHKEPIIQIIQRISTKVGIPINELQLEKIAYSIAICLIRVGQGNYVSSFPSESPSILKEDFFFKNVTEVYGEFLQQSGVAIEKLQNEVLFATLLVSVSPLGLLLESPFLTFQRTIVPICEQMTEWVIKEIKKISVIRPSEYLLLRKRLTYIHVEAFFFHPILKKKVLFSRGTPQFKQKKSAIRESVTASLLEKLKQREKKEQWSYFTLYESFFAQHYEVLLEGALDWRVYFPLISLQLQTDDCIYTSEEIGAHIQWLFPDQVKLLPQHKVGGESDILLTTSNIKLRTDGSVVVWNQEPTLRDWQVLAKVIDQKARKIRNRG